MDRGDLGSVDSKFFLLGCSNGVRGFHTTSCSHGNLAHFFFSAACSHATGRMLYFSLGASKYDSSICYDVGPTSC
jgi:hypothetical protein